MLSHYLKECVTPTKVRKASIQRGPLHSPYRKACIVFCSLSRRRCRDANSIPLSVVAANDLECAEPLIDPVGNHDNLTLQGKCQRGFPFFKKTTSPPPPPFYTLVDRNVIPYGAVGLR